MNTFMLGTAAVLAVYRGAQRVWEWTGAALFPRFWSGPLDPAGLRLFQDAAGATQATVAGQPIGKLVRADGTVDATQATALSRPTLARWPKGGRRNLLTWTADLSNSVWIASNAGDYTMGYPDPFGGNQAIRWKPVFTTDPGGSTRGASLRQAAPGAVTRMRYSIYVKRVKVVSRYPSPPDTPEADRDVFMRLQHQSNGDFIINLRTLEVVESASGYVSKGIQDVGGGWLRIWLTGQGTVAGNGNTWVSFSNRTNQANFDPYPDGTEEVHLYGTMLELGDHIDLSEPPGPPQIVTTVFDIRQPGSPDIWHLWNDGGDSLLASFPSGTYEVATVGIAGRPHYASLTGDGSGKNILLGADRIADIFVRAGTLTDAERARLEEYWQERLGAGYLIPPGIVPGTRPMWQEAGGTTPVTAAGQPVGRIDDAFSGVSATQSTALSRPTLARHPKGGVRNVLLKADAPLSGTPWHWSTVTPASLGAVGPNGSHVTRVTPQVAEAGISGAGLRGGTWLTGAMVPVGSRWTFSALFKSDGLRYALLGGNNGGGGYYVGAKFDLETGSVANVFNHPTPVSNVTAHIQPAANGFWRCSVTFTVLITNNQPFTLVLSGAINTNAAQQSGDGSSGVLVAEPQVEAGEVATPFQKSASANDVSEYGVPDVWHLWNDGGDSLPAVLPAGAYEIAWVNHLGVIGYASVTSDGTSGTELLRAERMADVAVKRGRFTSYEKAQLETQWGKYKP